LHRTLEGETVTTCTRCGKENQDHYKFCLGCGKEMKSAPKLEQKGDKLEKVDKVELKAPVHEPASSDLARTVIPAEELARAAGLSGVATTPQPQSPSPMTPRPRGGIPWNDSPRMPPARATSTGVDPGLTPLPTSMGAPLRAYPETTATDAPPSPWAASRPVASNAAYHEPGSGGQLGGAPTGHLTSPVGAGAILPSGATVCPNCGRTVIQGFAFCGSCGTRIASAGPGIGAGAQKTMSMPTGAVVPRGRILLIRPDGTEGGAHPLHDGENLVGRGQGSLFEGDLYLSPRHAEFVLGSDGLVVRDLRSLNGVFVKIDSEEMLESGDVIRVGQELLRFEIISAPAALEDGTEVAGTPNPGFWGRLSVIVGRDVDGSAFPLFGDAIVMGRERGDILFPEDGYVSGTHARISLRDGRVYLVDVGSSNGTFLRVRGERRVAPGAFILMGQQLFRVDYRA